MNRTRLFAVAALTALAGAVAVAQTSQESRKPAAPSAKPAQPAGKDAHAAQPGDHAGMPQMTEQQMKDMQACMEAGTPGEMHAYLAESVGTWAGKSKMWMSPDAPPMESTCTAVISPMMDGRYISCKIDGEMPGGMGMFSGQGVYAYDNVSKTFQSTWIDNWSTGIAVGKGELSSDQKVMTWTLTYNCPIKKKPTTMREVQTKTGPDSSTLEMYGIEPHTGKEFKMMEISYTRKKESAAVGSR